MSSMFLQMLKSAFTKAAIHFACVLVARSLTHLATLPLSAEYRSFNAFFVIPDL
jgi:hypothetical protein